MCNYSPSILINRGVRMHYSSPCLCSALSGLGLHPNSWMNLPFLSACPDFTWLPKIIRLQPQSQPPTLLALDETHVSLSEPVITYCRLLICLVFLCGHRFFITVLGWMFFKEQKWKTPVLQSTHAGVNKAKDKADGMHKLRSWFSVFCSKWNFCKLQLSHTAPWWTQILYQSHPLCLLNIFPLNITCSANEVSNGSEYWTILYYTVVV